jgi:hypothetical protein
MNNESTLAAVVRMWFTTIAEQLIIHSAELRNEMDGTKESQFQGRRALCSLPRTANPDNHTVVCSSLQWRKAVLLAIITENSQRILDVRVPV